MFYLSGGLERLGCTKAGGGDEVGRFTAFFYSTAALDGDLNLTVTLARPETGETVYERTVRLVHKRYSIEVE